MASLSTPASSQSDVIVIGGGPGGSTVSTLIAKAGHQVELFEREHFPRFHVGESLIPHTYHVLERLDMLPKMKASRFVKKYSVQFINQHGRLSEPFYFLDHKPHESSQTWQVVRSDFDHMMLENAREHGVTVHEGVRVLEVLFDGERCIGVRVREDGGKEREVLAKVVVDASGQSSMIASRLKLREWDPVLRRGPMDLLGRRFRDVGRDEGATIVIQTQGKKGWFWYIPLYNDVVSVGVVAAYDYLFKDRGDQDNEAIYFEEVARCPGIEPRLAKARRVAPFRAAKEYSYQSRQAAGPGWVLVGDAFGFLDPLYSSGVLLALTSGQMAADAVIEGLRTGDTSAAKLGVWQQEFVKGMNRMRRLVCEFYDGFSFGRFIRRHPHLKGYVTDLLIGDLFKDDVDQVWPPMDAMRKEEGRPAHAPAL